MAMIIIMDFEASSRGHKSQPTEVSHTLTPYLFRMHFKSVILLATPMSPSGLFRLGFRTEMLYAFLISPSRTTCAAHLIFFYSPLTKPEI